MKTRQRKLALTRPSIKLAQMHKLPQDLVAFFCLSFLSISMGKHFYHLLSEEEKNGKIDVYTRKSLIENVQKSIQ